MLSCSPRWAPGRVAVGSCQWLPMGLVCGFLGCPPWPHGGAGLGSRQWMPGARVKRTAGWGGACASGSVGPGQCPPVPCGRTGVGACNGSLARVRMASEPDLGTEKAKHAAQSSQCWAIGHQSRAADARAHALLLARQLAPRSPRTRVTLCGSRPSPGTGASSVLDASGARGSV
jgi:hypothetical protein